nr:tetratricopeptide repeat protein [Kibdelosporangium sp. MJ126-NF4]CEL17620.1 transcriptional regulator, SARP family [Kibdelosporangium sp. MJ126-NF4]CTQ91152.1 transcriptional regulator, SARP family [Kibdelosporangium sp. MJ126-NF4]
MTELSEQAQHVLSALMTIHPAVTDEEVHLSMVAALLGGSGSAAQNVLAELGRAGYVTQHGAYRYQLHKVIQPASAQHDPTVLRPVVEWMAQRATQAERIIQPHSWRLSSVYQMPGQVFTDADHAMNWFREHRVRLMTLLTLALDQGWNELAWQVAEPLWGLCRYAGQFHDELVSQQIAVQALDRLNQQRASVFHSRAAHAHTDLGQHEHAEREATLAIGQARAAKDRMALSTALYTRGRARHAAGDPRTALSDYQEALELAVEVDSPRSKALRHRRIGAALAELDETDRALAHLRQAVALMDSISDHVGHARALTELGRVLRQAGHPYEASDTLGPALLVMRNSGSDRYIADVLTELGHTSEATGGLFSARNYFTEAADKYAATGRADLTDRLRAHLSSIGEESQ